MSAQTIPTAATRYVCAYSATDPHGMGWKHTSGLGTPKRKTCAYCGTRSFLTLTGWWGVFVHSSISGDTRYRADSAESLHSSERKAGAVIDADTTGRLVVRWVSAA